VLRVPLIVHAPGRVPAAVVETPVSLVDLYPSLQVVLEIGTGRFDQLDGTPLFTMENGRAVVRPRSTPIFAELVLRERFILRAQISAAQKSVAATRWPRPAERPRETLPPLTLWPDIDEWFVYDLKADAGELTNVADESPEAIAAFQEALDGYRARCEENGIAPRDLVDAMEIGDTENRESLETLGYL
jgi:arylsulfatase A-like enzyme